jgi:hypothetical protein
VLDALGLSEDKEAGRFLNGGFDPLLVEAGVPNGMVIHHMGHLGDRARGDSSMLGWGDTWKVSRDDPDDPASVRYFSAYGRDIDVHQGTLEMDDSRHLTLLKGGKKDAKNRAVWEAIAPWIQAEEPVGSVNQVKKAFDPKDDELSVTFPAGQIDAAIKWAQINGLCSGSVNPGQGKKTELRVIRPVEAMQF